MTRPSRPLLSDWPPVCGFSMMARTRTRRSSQAGCMTAPDGSLRDRRVDLLSGRSPCMSFRVTASWQNLQTSANGRRRLKRRRSWNSQNLVSSELDGYSAGGRRSGRCGPSGTPGSRMPRRRRRESAPERSSARPRPEDSHRIAMPCGYESSDQRPAKRPRWTGFVVARDWADCSISMIVLRDHRVG